MIRKDRLERAYNLPPRPPLCRFGQGDESRDYDPEPEPPCNWQGQASAMFFWIAVAGGIVAVAGGIAELMIRGMR